MEKGLVVNVNKMKKCCVKTAPPPSVTRVILVRVQEGDESQDMANDERIIPLASNDHFENESLYATHFYR